MKIICIGRNYADHAKEVASACGFLVGQTAKAENEENGCTNVSNRGQVRAHELCLPIYFLNIASMR